MIFRHPVVVEIEKEAIMPGDPTRMEEKSTANVRRNPVIYRCPTPDPAQALIFGGGATGGTVHMPDDSLYLSISRGDLWNEKAGMGAIAAVRLRGSPGLFTSQNDIRQECDLSQAKLWFRIETSDGEVRIRLTCLRGRDVVSLEIEDDRSSPGSWSLAIENWHEGEAVTRVDDSLLETTHVNRSSCFAEHNQAVGVNASVLGLSDPLLGRAWGLWVYGPASARSGGAGIMTLPPAHCQRALVATACDAPVSGKDVQDIVSARGRALARTPADTLEAWHIDHRQWWQRFWESSFIRLQSLSGEAEYEERLWYANLYALACGMGGPYPMRFNGGPFLLEKDCRTWDHGYWGQNMRLVYFPMLAAGHCDFVREYIDWYLGNSDFVRDQTKSLFGVDGLAWRETQSFWGADTASSLAEPNGMMHHHFTNNLEFCLLMELYYRATGDEVFLREQFFPALRGVLEFFRRYATSGSDGLLHLQPAGAVEIWPQMIDPQSEICGLHHFLPRAIDWAGQFEENNELIGSWRDFLAHLPAVPIGRWHIESAYDQGIHDERWLTRSELREDGIYLPAAGQTRERTQRVNMENAELYIVFPWNQVNLDSPEPERRRIESTWNHRTWRYQNNGWAQDTVQLARLGWREELRHAIREHAGSAQRFPNGLFISPADSKFHGLLTATPYFDSAGVHLTALQEMFVQNQDGLLKLAPAVPESWSGECSLHALDGLRVELRVREGLPIWARITALRDHARLRLKNHRWEALKIRGAGIADALVSSGGIFEAQLTRSATVVLRWDGVDDELPTPLPVPEVVWPEFRCRGPLAAYRSGHWHDERINHGQIGLAEDGLFPATRRPPVSTAR